MRAGKNVTIKVSGTAVSMTGEATISTDNQNYQISDENKQVFDREASISVHILDRQESAEAGTDTTTVNITGHGLQTGDLMVNTDRDNAARIITRVDDDQFTVTAVTDQTVGDDIDLYPIEVNDYTLNRLNGTVTYSASISRTIRITGEYLPMSDAAEAHSKSVSKSTELLDVSSFGDDYRKRINGLLSASGTLNKFNVTDDVFVDALLEGNPVVIEDRDTSTGEPNRVWAMLESAELAAAVDGVQEETVSWQSKDKWLKLGG